MGKLELTSSDNREEKKTENDVNQLWLVTHAERLDVVNKNWHIKAAKPFDPPISERGHLQAHHCAKFFSRQKNIKAIIAPPSTRCLETASRISEVLNLPVFVENGLFECLPSVVDDSSDLLELVDLENLFVEFPRVNASYQSKVVNIRFPETLEQAKKRLKSVVKSIAEQFCNDGSVVIVGDSFLMMELSYSLSSVRVKSSDLLPCTAASFSKRGLFWRCTTKPVCVTAGSTCFKYRR
eukprot:TRINITY_DN7380_c0_g1_i1.p1 TRINITY_DN7380_c0_g1~~TRINITY_DN7380_c0_g1_i1.p1  ORF type:complete len:260 (-),score=47.11 TRINITY_DN7380_c0_g1_i1:58-771(-)